MKVAIRLIAFLVLNFLALGVGGLLMGNGPSSDWYLQLNKAPWTPPGWVFGVAWTTIMLCFAAYMALGWSELSDKKQWITLYTIQWVLNVSWNPLFFRYHQVGAALVVIILLTILIAWFLFGYCSRLRMKSVFILPYFLWLMVATSLNAYIRFMN
jgi:tryptophan-rich sensory protein